MAITVTLMQDSCTVFLRSYVQVPFIDVVEHAIV